MAASDDGEVEEDYFIPLEDQRVFGAGLKRKRVAFVPSSSARASTTLPHKQPSDVRDRYLSIVLPPAGTLKPDESNHNTLLASATDDTPGDLSNQLCSICSLPLHAPAHKTLHEASIPHQASLPHSHPPSHLPRQHVGLKYLSSYGWNPDSRIGLGAEGDGIRVPIKAKEKHDTVGIGADAEIDGDVKRSKRRGTTGHHQVKKLNAKEVRKMEDDNKKKADKLRRAFYQDDEVAKYLGEDG